ncbi:unnamed protein product [Symbiodinium microadriaticum]|nr:unnamed protein product [Symbiodinium microadriaticum]CAE7331178.1 unnamed protein product [Symbiodinium sp. KB8]
MGILGQLVSAAVSLLGPALECDILDLTSDDEESPPENSVEAARGSAILAPFVTQPSYVYHGVYCAGARALTPVEMDLKYEFLQRDLYLVRGAQAAQLSFPSDDPAELIAFSMVIHGQAGWQQLLRMTRLLP